MSNSITVEDGERCVLITFNRPEIRSPLSVHVLQELLAEFARGIAKPVVFTGRDGVFASGADLREIAALDSSGAADFARRGQELMNIIAGHKYGTSAAIDGFCFGGALDLALACGRRVASRRSRFAHPGAGLGIITGWGGTQRLPRQVGEARALEMLFTAEPIGAAEALEIGLIDSLSDEPAADAIRFISQGN